MIIITKQQPVEMIVFVSFDCFDDLSCLLSIVELRSYHIGLFQQIFNVAS